MKPETKLQQLLVQNQNEMDHIYKNNNKQAQLTLAQLNTALNKKKQKYYDQVDPQYLAKAQYKLLEQGINLQEVISDIQKQKVEVKIQLQEFNERVSNQFYIKKLDQVLDVKTKLDDFNLQCYLVNQPQQSYREKIQEKRKNRRQFTNNVKHNVDQVKIRNLQEVIKKHFLLKINNTNYSLLEFIREVTLHYENNMFWNILHKQLQGNTFEQVKQNTIQFLQEQFEKEDIKGVSSNCSVQDINNYITLTYINQKGFKNKYDIFFDGRIYPWAVIYTYYRMGRYNDIIQHFQNYNYLNSSIQTFLALLKGQKSQDLEENQVMNNLTNQTYLDVFEYQLYLLMFKAPQIVCNELIDKPGDILWFNLIALKNQEDIQKVQSKFKQVKQLKHIIFSLCAMDYSFILNEIHPFQSQEETVLLNIILQESQLGQIFNIKREIQGSNKKMVQQLNWEQNFFQSFIATYILDEQKLIAKTVEYLVKSKKINQIVHQNSSVEYQIIEQAMTEKSFLKEFYQELALHQFNYDKKSLFPFNILDQLNEHERILNLSIYAHINMLEEVDKQNKDYVEQEKYINILIEKYDNQGILDSFNQQKMILQFLTHFSEIQKKSDISFQLKNSMYLKTESKENLRDFIQMLKQFSEKLNENTLDKIYLLNMYLQYFKFTFENILFEFYSGKYDEQFVDDVKVFYFQELQSYKNYTNGSLYEEISTILKQISQK